MTDSVKADRQMDKVRDWLTHRHAVSLQETEQDWDSLFWHYVVVFDLYCGTRLDF